MRSNLTMLGVSGAIRGVEEEIDYAARSGAKVLITGESGVGKEVVARLIHARGSRRNAPLVPINCAGIPDSLLESELFGHVKGSFTDAHRDKAGFLERAEGGTVFMDEIGEMSLRMQALLLRFLETGEIQRVGSDRHIPNLDVRVIAATHRRLITLVAERSFREDLYYRLNVIHIEVPPLRERREDIVILLRHFLTDFGATYDLPVPELSVEATKSLTDYHWPGNVRELRNVAERLILRRSDGRIENDAVVREIGGGTATARRPARTAKNDVPTSQVLFERILKGGASFWSVAYEPFMARDLTRKDIRDLVRLGLEHTRGNYKLLVTTFNMAPEEYKKFLNFLRKYQCHVPFQGFRMVQAQLP
ncbi:MAG TPA: sigma-54 dependent transcriptional regulator, partial [Vicinamibacterales bacterium]|nr:sigma-54 dependent transcriptional regulator [Vicinamibacterales bacterium]